MRKHLILILIACTYCSIAAQKKHEIKIEVGYSTSIFLQKNAVFSFKQNTPIYEPKFFKIGYSLKNYVIGFNYKYYGAIDYYNPWKLGDIELRQYHAFDLSLGKKINFKHQFTIVPTFLLSARPSGTENVYIYNSGSTFIEPNFHNYTYNSKGFGLALDIEKTLYKGLLISFEGQYNYYFEKKKLRGRAFRGYEDYHNNYKVNRSMITMALKLGYKIQF